MDTRSTHLMTEHAPPRRRENPRPDGRGHVALRSIRANRSHGGLRDFVSRLASHYAATGAPVRQARCMNEGDVKRIATIDRRLGLMPPPPRTDPHSDRTALRRAPLRAAPQASRGVRDAVLRAGGALPPSTPPADRPATRARARAWAIALARTRTRAGEAGRESRPTRPLHRDHAVVADGRTAIRSEWATSRSRPYAPADASCLGGDSLRAGGAMLVR